MIDEAVERLLVIVDLAEHGGTFLINFNSWTAWHVQDQASYPLTDLFRALALAVLVTGGLEWVIGL